MIGTNSYLDSGVAVIGMACRLPGADNLDQFWALLREGRTAWGPVPETRFNRRLYYHPVQGTVGKSYTDLAALVDYRPIDRSVCPISDAALASYDLAHVTLCEVAAAACRHAGLDPAALPYENTGVYVGHAAASEMAAELTYATYIAQTATYLREAAGFDQLAGGLGEQVIQEMIDTVRAERPRRGADGWPIIGASMAAALIAKTFALNGPYMSFNAACASSSRALAQGVRALQSGSIDMAIVGGASFFHSDTLVLFSQSRSVTTKGSHPFSNEADGMIVGEGYVALLLKRLGRAIADKDRILAVLPGIGVSSDGHGKSLWAPRQEGQIKAIQRAYSPEVSMAQLQYIEAHGTSTSLGDVTEINALTSVLQGQLAAGQKIPIGSAKLNVGHTLESAGLVGVVKTVLALQHELIPPAIDQRPLCSEVDWDLVPLYPPRQPIPWPRSNGAAPRRAGVDAFGIGGLNVHVVVDEFRPPTSKIVSSAPATPATESRATDSSQDHEDERAVAIIGMGAVMPGALTLEAFWELLTDGRDPKIEVPADRWDARAFCRADAAGPWLTPTSRGGYVTGFQYDWRKHKIPPKQVAQATPLQFMILDAVDQAIQRAKYHDRPFDHEQVGVVVGTIFGGDYAAQLVIDLRLPEFQQRLADLLRTKGVPDSLISQLAQSYGDVLLAHMPALLDETGSFTASALASRITKSFNLMGGAVAVDAGQASSLAALNCCLDQLRHGDCEMMVCVGGQYDMTPVLYEDWSLNGRLAVGETRSPFDVRADGALPAEGCGALLLKRLADARRDHDPVLGIIRGIGAAHDPCPSEAARLAIRRALKDSRLTPADVAVIETSIVGKAEEDAVQLHGIADAYAERAAAPPIVLSNVVGQIGDAGGASGMASLLKATMELDTLTVPAESRLEHPAPYLTRHSAVLAAPSRPSPLAGNREGRVIAGIHCGGTGEVTYHVCVERGVKMNSPTDDPIRKVQQSGQSAPAASNAAGGIPHFDATERRRRKLREKGEVARPAQSVPAQTQPNGDQAHTPTAASERPAALAPVRRLPPAVPAKPANAASPAAPPMAAAPTVPPSAPRPIAPAQAVPPTAALAMAAPSAGTPVASAVAAPQTTALNALDPKELEKFLVDFVVEHTGYPPEIVELDADLEADLGIDSIKKAQLFGELGEYFDVRPSEDLSLDNFPTLRHVLDYLVRSQPSGPAVATAPSPPPSLGAAAVSAVAAPPLAAVEPVPAAAGTAVSLDPKELEKFLVDFVVEHTGYPPEIVELDADLEADLGIDSIKKAQLFGELGEYFDVRPSEDLSLDNFPTLRHVLDYLVKSQQSTPATVVAPTPPPSLGPATVSAVAVPQPAAVEQAPAAPGTAGNLDPKELEKFLVDFVVEHTGYPPEIVELDADLEADLGIDSIKKAQLFGELSEYFDVHPSEDLSLDDFPTLRHVLNYLLQGRGQ